jgi:hypothetical protein
VKWKPAVKIGCKIGCIALAVLLVVASPVLMLPIMLIAGSERTIYERANSTDNWHEARVQFDDGGAISGFERLVFVKHAWNFSDAPLLSCRAFWGHGEAKIHLRWIDSSTLVIEHHVAPKNVAAVSSQCGSVKIVLRPMLPYENF